ncbi:MAG: aminodeoxychorismate synthase, component, partial [Cohnella sp.]|nr:aminodeoxychorismate synthase, component [Cohnella sp.]
MSWEQWVDWNGSYPLLPYVKKIPVRERVRLLPDLWDGFWAEASEYACLLESGKGGRYSIIGPHPVEVVTGKGRQIRFLDKREGNWIPAGAAEGHPVERMRQWIRLWTAPKPEGVPDCIGGVLGFWSYDMVRHMEKLPEKAKDDLELPDFLLQRFEQLWIADHHANAVYLAIHTPIGGVLETEELAARFREAQETAEEMERSWNRWCAMAEEPGPMARRREMVRRIGEGGMEIDVERLPGLATSFSKPDFMDAVDRIRQDIAQGDVFQVNLSLRQSRPVDASPEGLYDWLRMVNPSPYMGFLRTPSFSLVSASPELLVKLKSGRLTTRPIAGTRRRGRTPEEERALEEELLASEKER